MAPRRIFCWHCEERIIGRLIPLERFPHCGQCPPWDIGCNDKHCAYCRSEAELRARLKRRQPQRTNKDTRGTATGAVCEKLEGTPKRKPPKPFSRAAAGEYAALALAHPPKRKFIERVEPVGELIAQFVLPSKLCLTANERKGLHWRAISKVKQNLLGMMFAQAGFRKRDSVLPGRPQVLVTRFTCTRPDRGAGWEKDVIDALLTSQIKHSPKGAQVRRGLGFFEDDSDMHIDARAWWEPGPRENGFVLLRVFGGEK